GAFADDKSVAISFKRARRMDWIVVVGGKRAHGREPCHAHRRDCRLRAAGDHHVGIATFNDLETVANGVGARGTGGGGGGVWSLRAETNGNLSGGEIHDRGNDKKRRHAVWSIVEQFRVLALDGPE